MENIHPSLFTQKIYAELAAVFEQSVCFSEWNKIWRVKY